MEAGTQFIGVKPGINMQERKSNVANNPTDVFTIEDIAEAVAPVPSYKVYTALLTQSGSDAPQSISTGTLTMGVSYYFADFNEPEEFWDFSNVGGPIYPDTDPFVATNTSEPNSFGSANIGYNTGAPVVVTVLENTIGNIWFTYNSIGYYNINQDFNFIPEKTFVILTNNTTGDVTLTDNMAIGFELYKNSSTIIIDTTTNGIGTDGVLFNTPIEIRVYPSPAEN